MYIKEPFSQDLRYIDVYIDTLYLFVKYVHKFKYIKFSPIFI